MNESPPKPSTITLILVDRIALLCVLFPIVLWGLFIYNGYIADGPDRADAASFFRTFAIPATVIGIPLLAWRLRNLRSYFTRGVEVTGLITGIAFRGDQGRLEYSYTYEGESYQAAAVIQKTRKTMGLQPGDEITLLVHPQNPKRALIRDIYV